MLALAFACLTGTAAAGQPNLITTDSGQQSFTDNGACYQTYTVPDRVTELEVDAVGGLGSDGQNNVIDGLAPANLKGMDGNAAAGNSGWGQPGGTGGFGSEVETTINVTPGQTLYVGPASEAFPGGGGGLAGMNSSLQPSYSQLQALEPGAGGAGGNASFVSTSAPAQNPDGSCTFTATQLSNDILVVAAGGGGGGGAGSGEDDILTNGLLAEDPGGDGGSEVAGQAAAQEGGGSLWHSESTADSLNDNGDQDEGSAGGAAADQSGGINGIGGSSVSTISDWSQSGRTFVAGLICTPGSNGSTGAQNSGGAGGSAAQIPADDPDDMTSEPNLAGFLAAESSSGVSAGGGPGAAANILINQLLSDPNAPQVWVDGCGGEDDATNWSERPSEVLPGLSSGGGGGGGGGYYGGGGGGGADDFYINAGGGGGGAGSSYVQGQSAAQTAGEVSLPSSAAQVTLTPVETAPTILQSSPTLNCTINQGCSLELDSTGYLAPQFGFTTTAQMLPAGLQIQQSNNDGAEDGWAGFADISGAPTQCSDVGDHNYSGEIEAINDAGSATLPALGIDISPGALSDISLNTVTGDPSTLIGGDDDTDIIASADYASGCSYDVSGNSGGSWTVTGSEGAQGQPVSNTSVVTLSAQNNANPADDQMQLDPVATGTANVNFTYTDAWGQTATKTIPVTVTHGAPQSIFFADSSCNPLSGAVNLVPGQNLTPQICANFGNGDIENVTDYASYEGTPSGLNEAGISVSGGTVLAGSPLGLSPGEQSQSGDLTAYLGDQTASLPVTVSFNNPSSLSISGNAAAEDVLSAGSTNGQLSASATYGGYGVPVDVTKLVSWTTADADRAQVENGGSGGSLDIPYYTLGGPVKLSASLGTQSASYQANVQLGTPDSMTVSDSSGDSTAGSLGLGDSEQLSVTGYVDSEAQDVTNQVTWSSSDSSAVSVDSSGIISAVGAGVNDGGEVQITADDNGIEAIFTVTISLSDPSQITVSPGSTTIPLGSYATFTATGTYPGGRTADITQLATWATSTPTLGSFQSPGLLSANGSNSQGLTASVSASLGGVQGQADVTEQGQAPNGVTVNGSAATLGLGNSEQLSATANFDDNSTSNVTGVVTWSVQDPSLFTVSQSGLVTATGGALADGGGRSTNVQATLTYNDGSGTVEKIVGSYFMTVSVANPTSITITPPAQGLFNDSNLAFTATGNYPNGYTADLSYLAKWTTSDTNDTAFGSGGEPSNYLATDNLSAPGSTMVTASYGGVSSQLTLPLSGPFTLTGPSGGTSNLNGTVGQTYTYQFSVAGGSENYTWQILNPYDGDQPTTNPDVQLSATSGNTVTVNYTPSAADFAVAQPPGVSAEPYSFEVQATDTATNESQTQQVSVNLTRQAQTLNWVQTLPPTAQYGTSTFLSGTSSAGLQTTIAQPENDPGDGCTISGNEVEFDISYSSVCEVELTQAGTNTFAPTSITATINVTVPADLAWDQFQEPPAEGQVGNTQGFFDALPDQFNSQEPQDPGAITYTIDPATTNSACHIASSTANYAQVSWDNVGSCVVDATIAADTNQYGFSFPAQTIQTAVPVAGGQSYLLFGSSAPSNALVGQSYTPSFNTQVGGTEDPLQGISPATPTVTVDAGNSSPANACTTNGTSVTFVHAGTCVIQGVQAQTNQYAQIQSLSEQTINVGTGNQAITYPGMVTSAYIPGSSVTLNPSGGGSGNAVTLSVDSSSTDTDNPGIQPCSINGNTVTFNDAGKCVIDANQAGNSDYNSAPQVQKTFTVQDAHVALVSTGLCSDAQQAASLCTEYQPGPLTTTASSGAPLPVEVVLENAAGTPVGAPGKITVNLSASSGGSGGQPLFQSTSGADQVVIPPNAAYAIAYYGDATSGTDEIFATAQLTNSAQTQISSPTVPVTVTSGPVAALQWESQPSDTTAGQPLAAATVQTLDSLSNPVIGAQVTLTATNVKTQQTVTIDQDSSETTAADPAYGDLASFNNLTIDTAGTYTLTASAGGQSVTSSQFTVSPATTSSLSFTEQPGDAATGQTLAPIRVQATDAYDNPVSGVTVTLENDQNQGAVVGTAVTDANGEATFNNVTINGPGSYTLTADDANDNVTQDSDSFEISPTVTNLASAYVAPGPAASDSNNCGDDATPCATISGALAELAAGGTVHVSGTINENNVTLTNPVTIEGAAGTDPTIDGGHAGNPIFTIGPGLASGQNVTLSGLTLRNGGAGSNGGAILDQSPGTVSVNGSTFSDNTAGSGGAIYANGGGTLEISGSVFSGNTATGFGGAIDSGDGNSETLNVTTSTFTNNTADVGGAIDTGENQGSASTMTLLGSTFTADNAATGSEIVFGSGNASYAGNIIDGSCAGTGTQNDLGYNAAADGSCYGSPVPSSDATAGSGVGTLTANADGTQTPGAGNPAINLIPAGAGIQTAGGAVTLCSATDKAALFAPGAGGSCDAGAWQPPPVVVIPPAASALTVATTQSSVVYGKALKVSGELSSAGKALSGQTVTLLYRKAGSSGAYGKFATTAKSSSTGAVSFTTFKPDGPVQVELSYAGSAAYKPSTSAARTIAAQFAVSLSGPSSAKKGKSVSFSGAVSPKHKGLTVYLQRKSGSSWKAAASTKLTAAGKYSLKLKLTAKGKFSYRVLIKAADGFGQTLSATKTLTVK